MRLTQRHLALGAMAATALLLSLIVLNDFAGILPRGAADMAENFRQTRITSVGLADCVMICLIYLYWREQKYASRIFVLALTLPIPFVFSPTYFDHTIPQALWIPFITALAISSLRWALLTLAASIILAMATYPKAYADPAAVLVSLIIAVGLIAARLTQRQLLLDSLEAKRQAEQSKAVAMEAELRYRTLASGGFEGIAVSEQGRLIDANEQLLALLGYTHDDLIGRPISDLLAEEERGLVLSSVQQNQESRIEHRLVRKDGGAILVEAHGQPVEIGGRLMRVTAVRDITERKRTEAELLLAASVFTNSYEAITITDAENLIIDVNPAFSRVTGYSKQEVLGKNPRLLSSGIHDPAFYTQMWTSLLRSDCWFGEIWNKRKNGEVFVERLSISAVRDAEGKVQHYIAIFSDITELKNHQAELDRIAHFDVLTGVPNRRLLAERLGQAIAHARHTNKPLAVCYLDLDGFKPINDRLGHSAGDQLLIELSMRLQKMLRSEDTIGRLGGDEFVLLLVDLTHTDECFTVLERVLESIRLPVVIDGVPVSVSASVGVAFSSQEEIDADTMLRHADQAMYRAKEEGKNRFHVFDPERDRQVKARRHNLQRLEQALKNGEFRLYYQPKVDLVSGAIIGAEALIRWQHPKKGLLPPGDFLQPMEGSPLESAVGEWVIESALCQLEAWRDIGHQFVVSVNISANHLLQPGFGDRLKAALERHQTVSPDELELEILESAALSDMSQASEALTTCRKLGVRFRSASTKMRQPVW